MELLDVGEGLAAGLWTSSGVCGATGSDGRWSRCSLALLMSYWALWSDWLTSYSNSSV